MPQRTAFFGSYIFEKTQIRRIIFPQRKVFSGGYTRFIRVDISKMKNSGGQKIMSGFERVFVKAVLFPVYIFLVAIKLMAELT